MALVAGAGVSRWSSFKAAVDKEFGFTNEQEQAAFYNLKQLSTETPVEFVLRIEAKRHQLGEPEAGTL